MGWAIKYFYPKHPLITLPGKTSRDTTFGYKTAMRLEDLMDLFAGKVGAKSIQADYLGIPSRGPYSQTFLHRRSKGKFILINYNADIS